MQLQIDHIYRTTKNYVFFNSIKRFPSLNEFSELKLKSGWEGFDITQEA